MRDETPLKKIQRLENHLRKNTTLDLIVLPELFLSGYGSHKKIKEFVTTDRRYSNPQFNINAEILDGYF